MNALTNTDFHFDGQTNVYHGKVRDVYTVKNDLLGALNKSGKDCCKFIGDVKGTTADASIAVRKDDDALRERLNKALDEIVAEIQAAHAAGQDVARLHSGDLSVWSAMGEQLRRLREIGIPYDESTQQIFQHFGKTAAFKIYTVADGAVQSSEVVTTGGQLHEGAAQLLAAHGVDTVICGGVGGGMQMALTQAGIRFYSGVQGAADAAAEALLAGNLAYDPAARGCQHHHEHGCGHAHA